jgi:hypothetical protein
MAQEPREKAIMAKALPHAIFDRGGGLIKKQAQVAADQSRCIQARPKSRMHPSPFHSPC